MHPALIVAGLALAYAAMQSKKGSPAAGGAGNADAPKADPAPAPASDKAAPEIGKVVESTDADGATVEIATVDGTTVVKPVAEVEKPKKGIHTAPAPQGKPNANHVGVGLAAVTAAAGTISPFAGIGAAAAAAAAKKGIMHPTTGHTTPRSAVQALKQYGPSFGGMW